MPAPIPIETIEAIELLAAAGLSTTPIARAVGVNETTAARYAKRWRKRMGVASPHDGRPLPGHQVASELVALIEALAEDGQSAARIASQVGVSESTVRHYCKAWQARTGGVGFQRVPPELAEFRRKCAEMAKAGMAPREIAEHLGVMGDAVSDVLAVVRARDRRQRGATEIPVYNRGGNHHAALDAGKIATIRQKLEAGQSLGSVARAVGTSFDPVMRHGGDILRRHQAAGRMCGCGQPLFHRNGCSHFSTSAPYMPTSEERSAVRAGFVRNLTVEQVAKMTGVPGIAVKRELRCFLLTPAGAIRRAQLGHRSRATAGPNSSQLARQRDPLFAKIAELAPRWADPALRDDIIADAYLAALEAGGAHACH